MSDLRSLALAATQGEWRIGRLGNMDMSHVVDFGSPPTAPFVAIHGGTPAKPGFTGFSAGGVVHSDFDNSANDAAFIAGAQPKTILSLLDERDADKARIEVLEKALREAGRVLAQPEIYSIWPVAALRMEIATVLNDTETAS